MKLCPSLPKNVASLLPTKLAEELLLFQECSAKSIVELGVCPDPILLQELKYPGSDGRCGVNFMARPPDDVLEYISRLQADLILRQPRQYFYPSADIHLTVLEVSFDTDWLSAVNLGQRLLSEMNKLVADLCRPVMFASRLVADRHGVALNFLPIDECLQNLRWTLRSRLTDLGLAPNSRYQAKFGHLTVMRYLEVVANPQMWTEEILGTVIDTTLRWEISELYLTWGADWYGMCSRNQQHGPFLLSDRRF